MTTAHTTPDADADLRQQLREGEAGLADEAFCSAVMSRMAGPPPAVDDLVDRWQHWQRRQTRRGVGAALGALAGLVVASLPAAPGGADDGAWVSRLLTVALVSALTVWKVGRSWRA